MRRKRGGGVGNVLGIVLIALVMVALGGFGAAAFFLRPPPTDPETLCRTDAPLGAHTIVLVDSTDRLEPRHRRKLRAVLEQERARLAQYDRLTVMRLNARRPKEPSVLFSRCLPRPPEQTNPLFENARLTQETWDAEFADALAAQRGERARRANLAHPRRAPRGRRRSRFRPTYPQKKIGARFRFARTQSTGLLALRRRRRLCCVGCAKPSKRA